MPVQHRYERILVPTDGSEAADVAIDHAVSIASDNGAVLHAFYVIDDRILMAAEADTRPELRTSLEAEGDAAVERIATRAEEADLEVTWDINTGTPSKEILDVVDSAAIDLVVMGTAGKSPREKRIGMGSVSERVVGKAGVPVMVVPE